VLQVKFITMAEKLIYLSIVYIIPSVFGSILHEIRQNSQHKFLIAVVSL